MSDLRSAPIPDVRPDDHVRGPEDGPLALFYGDFACPRCAVAHERLCDGGMRVVFRHFALRAKHPRAVALARAAEAAAAQGAFWALADALYADQARLEDPHLWARCEALGLDLERFEADRRSEPVAERVAADVRDALRGGATATPTLWRPSPSGGVEMVTADTMAQVRGEETHQEAAHRQTGGSERQ